MTLAVSVYKSGIRLATGTATGGSASVASVTAAVPVHAGRNVQILVTEAGTHLSRSWNTRVKTDGGTSLTLNDACPFIE